MVDLNYVSERAVLDDERNLIRDILFEIKPQLLLRGLFPFCLNDAFYVCL